MIKSLNNIIRSQVTFSENEIIFGSGFSNGMSNNGDVKLIYSSLLNLLIERMKKKNTAADKRILSLINKNMSSESNMEYYLKLMHESLLCLPFLNKTKYLQINNFDGGNVKDDADYIKEHILNAIAAIHPETWTNYSTRLITCAKNLSCFNRIYTLNYDLIVYWAILQHNSVVDISRHRHFMDGFSNPNEDYENLLTFSDSNNHANIMYLHGAIHLITNLSGDTYKIIKADKSAITLKELIIQLKEEYFKNGFENLMVFEGTKNEKIKIISANSYLHKCLQRLRGSQSSRKRTIFTYGCSIIKDNDLNNDEHIWSAIFNSHFDKIYIGIHEANEGKFSSEKGKILHALDSICDIEQYHRDHKIDFFTTAKDDIWSEDFTDF